MSWASIAKTQPKAAAAASSSSDGVTARAGLKLLVVDANAIIDGVKLEGIADRAVTIQEVLDEIKDKQSRQFLASLPYQLEVAEPTEDSIQAVTRFARATGDVAALSTVDIKLLALVHTLEVAAHGPDHLAAHPNQPRMHAKASFAEQQLPGWGNVPNPEDWKAVDEANEADEAALLAASTSRISQHVQQLTLDPTAPNSFLQDPTPEAAAGTAAAAGGGRSSANGPAAPLTPEAVSGGGPRTPASPLTAGPTAAAGGGSPAQQRQQDREAGGAAAGSAAAAAGSAAAAAAGGAGEAAGDGWGADGWEVAASSKGAARHKKRKEVKRQAHQHAFEQEWAEHSQLVQQQQQLEQPAAELDHQQQQQEQNTLSAASAAQQPQQQQEEEDGCAAAGAAAETDGVGSSRAAADATNEELLAEDHRVYTADDDDDEQQDSNSAAHRQQQQQQPLDSSGAAAAQQQQAQQARGPGSPGWQSSVAIITGDFAMQNVLLQMGLRLLTKDGRRIARLTRYALRCSACFTVTRDPGRLFCPKCGNLSLDRVEVVVGADGAEYFGVTKTHILRGTRFSLPKPKGGRAADDLVLREDVFLLKVKALGKKAVKKKAGTDDDDAATAAAAAAGGVDPFALEYSADTWHVPSQQELAQHRGMAAALQPAWKQNPNERKLTRSNRRG